MKQIIQILINLLLGKHWKTSLASLVLAGVMFVAAKLHIDSVPDVITSSVVSLLIYALGRLATELGITLPPDDTSGSASSSASTGTTSSGATTGGGTTSSTN